MYAYEERPVPGTVQLQTTSSKRGTQNSTSTNTMEPTTVAARSKAAVCSRLLARNAGSNAFGDHGCLSLVDVVCCQVEVSATD